MSSYEPALASRGFAIIVTYASGAVLLLPFASSMFRGAAARRFFRT